MRVLKSAGLGLIAAMALAAPASAGTLDQQQTEAPTDAVIGDVGGGTSIVSRAQTFTAGQTGVLDQVDLVLRHFAGTEPLVVEIRTVEPGGCPSTTVLASEQLQAADIPAVLTWVPVIFSTPTNVVAGVQYAIVLQSAGTYEVGEMEFSPYTAGQECYSFDVPPTTWTEDPDFDFAFKTYVAPPTTPITANCSGQVATQVGTQGNDVIEGTTGRDVIAALGGKDLVKGLSGKDRICGGRGKDVLKGGGGADKLKGGASSDLLKGGGGTDKCVGGPGGDTARKCEVEKST